MRQNDLLLLSLKTIVFLFILFLLDLILGSILANLYYRQKPGEIYRANYSIDSTKANILIFGSSRANHHYIPGIFEKRMNLSSYNTGRDGQTILYNYAVLKSVLKRYSPKIIILDVSREEFGADKQSYDRLSALIPYYRTHPEMREIIDLRGPFEKFKLLSKIYPYNSLIFTVIMGAAKSRNKRRQINEQSGYLPLTKPCKKKLATDTAFGTAILDSNKIKAFKSFVKDCKDSQVKLYVILSPLFIKYTRSDPSIKLAMNIARENNVVFYNFLNKPLFYHNNLFADDGTHLNDSGARLYTNLVIDSIANQKVNISREHNNN